MHQNFFFYNIPFKYSLTSYFTYLDQIVLKPFLERIVFFLHVEYASILCTYYGGIALYPNCPSLGSVKYIRGRNMGRRSGRVSVLCFVECSSILCKYYGGIDLYPKFVKIQNDLFG